MSRARLQGRIDQEDLVDRNARWSPDDFLAYAVQCEEQPLFESLDPPTQTRLVGLWRTRLAGLDPADLLVRDAVGYVTGRRP